MTTEVVVPRPRSLRALALIVHRYVGLVMAVFLSVSGLTGMVIAFNHELDAALNVDLMHVTPPQPHAPLLDPFVVAERVQAQLPRGQQNNAVGLDPTRDHALAGWLEVAPDEWREVFVNPYTGAIIGQRDWGNLTEGTTNLIPFIYRLHYSLALGDVGVLLFGLVALLWTLDCFVGAYLTFPTRAQRSQSAEQKTWLKRWLPMWMLRTNKLFSFVFTWHRASGLWLWALLLVFAWSAVGFNLPEAYQPVMRGLSGMQRSGHDLLPQLAPPFPVAKLSLREAYVVGQRLMAEQARKRSVVIGKESELYYANDHGAFVYTVHSNLDLTADTASTSVYFSGADGHLLAFDAPTGVQAGNTISSWLFALHMGAVGGLAYRILVCAIGLMVAALSVSGVWIWWRKRSKRRARAKPNTATPQAAQTSSLVSDA